MTYFSLSDSGNGSVLAVTWDGGRRLENLLKRFPKDRPRTILLDPLIPENSDISADPDIHHAAAIPASEAGEAELRRYSLPGLSSLRPASEALTSLFPGLRETGRKTVSLMAPKELMAMTASLPKPLRLVIDTPGAELDVLKAIEQAGLLRYATAIQLRCGIEPFFAQATESKGVLSWLEERFFRVSEKDDSDADWPEFLLLRDLLTEQIEELPAALQTMSKEHDKALTARENALAAAESITKHEAELKDRQNRIDALRDEMLRLRETLATAEERTARAEIDRDQARKDLGMALRNASGLRQDHSDLRDKYALLLNEKNSLEQLIQQLTPRLQEAAEHLRHFSGPVTENAELKAPEKTKAVRRKSVKRSSGTVT